MKYIDDNAERYSNHDEEMTNESTLTCVNCDELFSNCVQLNLHRSSCNHTIRLTSIATSGEDNKNDPVEAATTMVDVSKEEHINEVDEVIKHSQDAVNNNIRPPPSESLTADDGQDDNNVAVVANMECKESRVGEGAAAEAEPVEDGAELGGTTPLPQNHVTLEALQNTKVAVAQFAANALAAGMGNGDQETALKDLAVLHSTLFQLQHQHVFQLQLIQQLQSQLSMNNHRGAKGEDEEEKLEGDGDEDDDEKDVVDNQSENFSEKRDGEEDEEEDFGKLEPEVIISRGISPDQQSKKLVPLPQPPPLDNQPNSNRIPSPMKAPMCHISSSLASTIITNHDPPPSLDEPNSLEMLQKRAQEVLDSASQGLLAGNLADELAFRKDKITYDSKGRAEPFFKHRCRYCGKVFGSDSALQIHIRSHTGERPFKCNVCGSRFTTKGNLKVHFQRHTSKFPHIQMNPNPIPEHLDKYHPPLMAQLSPGSSSGGGAPPTGPSGSPGPHNMQQQQQQHHQQQLPVSMSMAFGGPVGPVFPGLNLYRPPPLDLLKPLGPHSLFGLAHSVPHMDQQDLPADLSSKPTNKTLHSPGADAEATTTRRIKMERSVSRSPSMEREKCNRSLSESPVDRPPLPQQPQRPSTKSEKRDSEEEEDDRVDEEALRQENERIERRQQELLKHLEMENERIRAMELERHRELEKLVREREKDIERRSRNRVKSSPQRVHHRSKSNEDEVRQGKDFDDYSMDSKYSDGRDQEEPENLSAKSSATRSPQNPQALLAVAAAAGVSKRQQQQFSKDAALYSTLLSQRPGSNDNSWESLIEVTKTSETSKLQQLVDNIENKLTDPNQCVVCHRVLSCKSALQMHYRTHTGERPFRCRICGRAFTTKGNLKTHMGVHRMKPPMRTLHQCPVCHKRYSNALVLQQHIRTHTGEPTDLTAEQISAAEVRDFPSLSPGSFPVGMNPFGFPMGNPGGGHSFPPTGISGSGSSQGDYDDEMMEQDDDFDEDNNSSFSEQASNSQSEFGLQQQMENQMRTITSMASQLSASNINKAAQESLRSHRQLHSERGSTPNSPQNNQRNQSSPAPSDNSVGALDLTPKNNSGSVSGSQASPPLLLPGLGHPMGHSAPHPLSMFPNFPMLSHGPMGSSTPMMNSALNSLAQSVLPASPFNPLGISGMRGNTTCNICFKTFACNSALEIHYRSHTKERPFKCTICDRGFSTKNEELLHTSFHFSSRRGNMKQHMLTHKIRDMPQHMFGNGSASSDSKSGRGSADFQETSSEKLIRRDTDSVGHSNNNNQREKNQNNSLDNRSRPELGTKRPGDAEESSQQPKRPLTSLLHARSATTNNNTTTTSTTSSLLASPPLSSSSSSSTTPTNNNNTTINSSPNNNSGPISNNSNVSLPMLRTPSPARSVTNRSLQSDRDEALPSHLTMTHHSPRPHSPSSQSEQQPQLPLATSKPSPIMLSLAQYPSLDSSPAPFEGGTFNSILHKAQQMQNAAHAAPELGLGPLQRELERSEQMEKAEKQSREQANHQQQVAMKEAGLENTKHLCTCCRKNFSSSSALQIHMRTHTGDKPFRCTVCQKAFTTKGNLKVHMGTHMWSNGASRRGRRMSLELPLNRPLPLNPQDTEFLQRRPDLFYPYLPAPFLNGMQNKLAGGAPPSMSSPQGLSNKYAGLLGFGGFLPVGNGGLQFPGAPHHLLSQTLLNASSNNNNNNSPSVSPTLSDKQLSSASPSPGLNGNLDEDHSPSNSPPIQDSVEATAQQKHIWDLHYEHARAKQDTTGDATATLEGLGLLSGTAQRSEGLAA